MVHKNSQNSLRQYTNLAQLITRGEYEIGALSSGSTYSYVQNIAVGEEFDIIRRTWQSPGGENLLVSTVDEGFQKVRGLGDKPKKYAFLTQSTTALYETNRLPCDLVTVGEVFAKRSFGFAVPHNSLILEELHAGILEMTEEGDIEALEQRWFGGSGQCWNFTRVDRAISDINNALYVDKPKSVDLNMFCGAIVLLVVGIIISLIIAFGEMMYYRQWGRVSQ